MNRDDKITVGGQSYVVRSPGEYMNRAADKQAARTCDEIDVGAPAVMDREFAGNDDPYWDLGDFAVESGFGKAQELVFLKGYLGRQPEQHEYGRLVLPKSLVLLLWTLYSVLEDVNKHPRPAYHFESNWEYAMDQFTRCQVIMSAEEFPLLVEAFRRSA